MATTTVNGTVYTVPETGSRGWGDETTNLLVALGDSTLQLDGGTFTLTNDVNFGATWGLIAGHFTSGTSDPATSGAFRAANADTLSWKNFANTGNIALGVNASDLLQFEGVELVDISTAQALTTKTIVAASNTITTAASGNLTSTELNSALAELQTDIDTRAVATDLTDHIADTTTHGTTGDIVGTSDAQLLTTKTIVVANNTVTTAASGNLTSTELNAALAELQTDVDTRALDSALTSHTGATAAHGVSGDIVGTTDSQILLGKTYDAEGTGNVLSNITNSHVKAAAGIAVNKLAALTASRATATDGSGFLISSSATTTELTYLSGVTSALQTQIDSKQADVITTRGDLVVGNASNAADRLAIGAPGQLLQSDGTDISWATVSGAGDVTAAAVITDNALVRGDGGAKGIQDSGILISDGNAITGAVTIAASGSITADILRGDTIQNEAGSGAPNFPFGASGISASDVSAEPANANIQSHISSTSNPHSVTASQVSLGNVTNESKATMFTDPAFTGTLTSVTGLAPEIRIVDNDTTIGNPQLMGKLSFYTSDTDATSPEVAYIEARSVSSSAATNLDFWTGAGTSAATNKMTLTWDGKLGVNTNEPDDKVEIYDGGLFIVANSIAADSGQEINFQSTTSASPTKNTPHARISGKRVDGSNGYLSLYTRQSGTTTEAMRLTQTGQTLHDDGTSANPSISFIGATTTGIWEFSNEMGFSNSGTTSAHFSSAGVFFLDTALAAEAGASTALYRRNSDGKVVNFTSSRKYKTKINPTAYGLAEVLRFRAVDYEAKAGDGKQFTGFIAEEMNEVAPNFVNYDKNGAPEGIHYAMVTSVNSKAIQELSTKLEAALVRIETLEGA